FGAFGVENGGGHGGPSGLVARSDQPSQGKRTGCVRYFGENRYMPTTSARLLALLSLLQVRRDWPGALLAERLDVSARTVRRDVDRLRELGYPIASVKGPEGGYRLEAGTDLPPLLFDDEQAVALAVGLVLAETSGVGIEDAAARALNTLRQVMPARLRHRIDTLRIAAVDTWAS